MSLAELDELLDRRDRADADGRRAIDAAIEARFGAERAVLIS